MQNINEFREIVEPNDDDPRLVILAMADDGDFRNSRIGHRLIECFVKSEPFAPFALNVNVRNIRNNIGRFRRALELHTASGSDAQDAAEFGGQFPFAPLTFRFGKSAHSRSIFRGYGGLQASVAGAVRQAKTV